MEAIINFRFVDADTDTWNPEVMDKLLARWENIKKEKHGKDCYDKWKHFSPFFLLIDGIMGKEALVVLANLSRLMVKKWVNPFCTLKAGLTVGSQL